MLRTSVSATVAFGILLLGLVGLVTPGCQTQPYGAQNSIAWIEISQHTSQEIRDAATRVLLANGYTPTPDRKGELVFDKPGDTGTAIVYGGWSSGADLRVQLTIRSDTPDQHLLACQAWAVRNGGDRLMEEVQQLKSYRKKSFQELLEQIYHAVNAGKSP